jgi:hypothetical protein
MFIVRAIAGDRVAYWDGARWTSEPDDAARYGDNDSAHEAAVAADQVGGALAGTPIGAQTEIVQL